ncbi:ABC transporter substrate-binding protein, partial [Enterococcus cecorum]
MKTWKKFIGVSAATLLAISLAACGNQNKSSSKDTKTGDSKSLLMYQVGDKPENFDELMKIANKRIKDKIGVTVDIQYIGWGDWDKKMPTIINSGESYDIAFAYHYVANAQKGAFADLTELSKKYAKDYLDQLPEMYIKGNEVDGKLYAIPVYGNAWGQQVLTFNDQYV